MAKKHEYPQSKHIVARIECIIGAKGRWEQCCETIKLYLSLIPAGEVPQRHADKILGLIEEAAADTAQSSSAICGDE
jgi:hypothetical protein